jgi:hypothetical protein
MGVRHLFWNGALFAMPLFVWVLIVVLVDPFDYFDISHVISEPVKVANAASLNQMMFNMLKEAHDPSENLIIGDSRVGNFSLTQIKDITGLDYHRLSSNKLKLNEGIDLFWFANHRKRIARVVFGINFNEYNEYAFADRAHSVEAVIHNPLLYLFDRSVAQASYYVVKAALTGHRAFSSVPPMSREQFWNYIVIVRAREHYERYRHPDNLYKRMREMVAFAKQQGTEVTFVIVPHHADFQQRLADFGLVAEAARFKRDLSNLGVRVVDYDYPNEITSNRANFTDPLHCNDAIAKVIVDEVFGRRLVLGKLCASSTAPLPSTPQTTATPVH